MPYNVELVVLVSVNIASLNEFSNVMLSKVNRLDNINRIKMWRRLTGNKSLDVDFWMSRIENERY